MSTLAKDPSVSFKRAALENSDNGRSTYELGSSYHTGPRSLDAALYLIISLAGNILECPEIIRQ